MVFLDPKIDFVFKKLFGTIANKDILIFFLNSILEKKESEKIIDVEINDTSNIKDNKESKESIVDVRCKDIQNKHYIIEMQVVKQKDFIARTQYYTAIGLTRQLMKKDEYEKLEPVIFIGILDFTLFKTDNFFSHHLVLDKNTYQQELIYTEYYFMELPKLKKELDQIKTFPEEWAYFFKYAKTFQSVPDNFDKPSFNKAFDVLAESNWTKAELEAYDRYLDAQRSRISQLKTAREEGFDEGEAKGIQKGKAEGKEEGLLEGKINIAKSMLKEKLNIELISKVTGLTIEEIKKLIV